MSEFKKFPAITIDGTEIYQGWSDILAQIERAVHVKSKSRKKMVLAVEVYPGAFWEDIEKEMMMRLKPDLTFNHQAWFKPEKEIRKMVEPFVGNDPVFGVLSYFSMNDFFDHKKLSQVRKKITAQKNGLILLIGHGASLIHKPDLFIYTDMARWEIQQRFRANLRGNMGVANDKDLPGQKYKWAFFVDWRVADRLKRQTMERWDFVLDTNERRLPKMMSGSDYLQALKKAAHQPFELKPFFDPGPWGGQWMKEVCDLDRSTPNFAWCFNCVPEENSLLFKVQNVLFEFPAINLVFYQPKALLGEYVYARFGAEFPIRFDFLDTWQGGNLSLQVHPTTDYIQNTFGWHYTQDESYYILDARPGARVFLGLKDGIDARAMIRDLKRADRGEIMFPAEKYVQTWPVKKHDHVLIPAGTVHCSGKDSLVLEISSTPYIFTFKLWDWGRLGLDGRPRPIHIHHGEKVIQFNRTTSWVKQNLINRIEPLAAGDGWREERTGLHEFEFIETRRHWFEKTVEHVTNGGVQVLNLVEGEQVIVESPEQAFEPLIVNYAETFVVPAAVGRYTIRPYGPSEGKKCATIKAFVKHA